VNQNTNSINVMILFTSRYASINLYDQNWKQMEEGEIKHKF